MDFISTDTDGEYHNHGEHLCNKIHGKSQQREQKGEFFKQCRKWRSDGQTWDMDEVQWGDIMDEDKEMSLC